MAVQMRRGASRAIVDMNVTPLVDVLLVLFVIVFVTAPLMSQGVDVNVPATRTVKVLPQDKDHLMVTLRKDNKIFIEEYETPFEELQTRLKQLVVKQDKLLYLKADKDVPYGEVVRVMGEIKAAGIDKMSVVAEADASAPRSKK